jgi:hypothetical protein
MSRPARGINAAPAIRFSLVIVTGFLAGASICLLLTAAMQAPPFFGWAG